MENSASFTEENNQVDYLASMEDPALQIIPATVGQRFLNFFIDNIFMNYALGFLTGALIGIIISAISPETLSEISANENFWAFTAFSLLIAYFNYVVYYTLCEQLLKGKTLGKLITGTRAVRLDGGSLTFKNALYRSLSRLVPFEAFSAFGGNPWHDRWTDTTVIKSR